MYMYSKGHYCRIYRRMGVRKKTISFLSVLVLSSISVRCDARIPRQDKTINLPPMGDDPDGGETVESRMKRTTEGDGVCTKDLQDLIQCSGFQEAVEYVIQERERKRETCVQRKGENAYYDSDMRACRDCFEKDCLQKTICERECKVILSLKDLGENANTTSSKLEDLGGRFSWNQRVDSNITGLDMKMYRLQSQMEGPQAKRIRSLEDKVAQLEDATKQTEARSINQNQKQKAMKEENSQLRRDNQNILLWCGFTTFLSVLATILAVIGLAWQYRKSRSNKYGVQEEGATSPLIQGSNTSSESSSATDMTTQDDATVDLRSQRDTPLSLNTNLVLSYGNAPPAPHQSTAT